MEMRGGGSIPGRDLSRHRAEVLSALAAFLEDVPFPAKREALCERLRGRLIPLGADGQQVDACDLVRSLEVDEFSSPGHVKEALNINWEDWADVYRPGGGG